METLSAFLAICAGNSPVPGEIPTQRPVTRSFDVFFDLRPNKRLSKQWWGWWFEMPSCPLWCHWNVLGKNLDHTWHYSWWMVWRANANLSYLKTIECMKRLLVSVMNWTSAKHFEIINVIEENAFGLSFAKSRPFLFGLNILNRVWLIHYTILIYVWVSLDNPIKCMTGKDPCRLWQPTTLVVPVLFWYIKTWAKWAPFCRRHFKISYLLMKFVVFRFNLDAVCSWRSSWQ